jgi:hypothetical protein
MTPTAHSPATSRRALVRLGQDYAYVLPGFFISLFGLVPLVPLFAAALGTAVAWLGVWLLPLVGNTLRALREGAIPDATATAAALGAAPTSGSPRAPEEPVRDGLRTAGAG